MAGQAPGSFSLAGKTAAITGAGSGMGRASAEAFAAAGAHVVVIDRDEAAGDAVCAAIQEAGGSAEPLALDLTDSAAIDAAFADLGGRLERLDVLFNHAGRECAPGVEITEEDWVAGVELNLKAPVFVTKAALPLLRESDGASLIYTASIAGIVASPMSPIYAAMKGGVVQYARSVAFALGPEGMRANIICPGPIETPMLPQFFGGSDRAEVEERVSQFLSRVPLRRTGRPQEIADVALFLASDASAYVSGVAIPVDGGYVAG